MYGLFRSRELGKHFRRAPRNDAYFFCVAQSNAATISDCVRLKESITIATSVIEVATP